MLGSGIFDRPQNAMMMIIMIEMICQEFRGDCTLDTSPTVVVLCFFLVNSKVLEVLLYESVLAWGFKFCTIIQHGSAVP